MSASRHPTILIVDDEPQLLALFSEVLADDYRVRHAGSGRAGLDRMDDDVDVVLLDRRMPGLSGEEVLQRLREAGHDVPVAMLTGEVPDFDVLEMGFDDYLLKPVGVDELQDTVETLLLGREYDEAIREWYALASKLAALRASKHPAELESDERFARAKERLEKLKRRAMRSLDTAIEAGKFEEVVTEFASTERVFEDIDVEGDAEFRFD